MADDDQSQSQDTGTFTPNPGNDASGNWIGGTGTYQPAYSAQPSTGFSNGNGYNATPTTGPAVGTDTSSFQNFIMSGGSPAAWFNLPQNGGGAPANSPAATASTSAVQASGQTPGQSPLPSNLSPISQNPTSGTKSILSDTSGGSSAGYGIGSGSGVPYTPPAPVNYGSGVPGGSLSGTGSGSASSILSGTGSTPPTAPPQGLVPQAGGTNGASSQPPQPPALTGGAGDAAALANYTSQYLAWTQANGSTAAPPPAGTAPPGSASWTPTQWNTYFTTQLPTGSGYTQPGGAGYQAPSTVGAVNPATLGTIPNPTGNGPNGSTTNYNPSSFPTQAAAQAFAAQYGGTVTPGNYLTNAPGSPYGLDQSQYYVTMPDGRIVNPNDLQYAANSGGANAQALINSVVNGTTTNGGYNPALASNGTTIPTYPTQQPITSPASVPNINPFTGSALIGGGSSTVPNLLSGGGSLTTTPPPATTNPTNPAGTGTTPTTPATTPTATSNGTSFDPTQLANMLLFLQAYSGLGSGGGNPTSVNPNSDTGQGLEQLLSALLGGQTLYSRQRQYPTTP